MPFTLAHPLLAIPFITRRRILLSAVVIGCLAPDFEYYLQMNMKTGRSGHMGWGILYFSIPAAGIALWGFHSFLKEPLLALLPVRHQRRLSPLAGPFSFFPARRFLAVLSSLTLGVALHVTWDLFCHPDGWRGAPLAFIETPVKMAYFGSIHLSDLLQAVFSGVGLFWLAIWYRSWLYRDDPAETLVTGGKTWPRRWIAAFRRKDIRLQVLVPILAVGLGFGVWNGVSVSQSFDTFRQWRAFGGRCLVGATPVFFFQFLVFALFWKGNPSLRQLLEK